MERGGEGVKLFYNGEDTKRNDVGIAVAESLKDSVAAIQRISDRIMSLRPNTKESCWTIMSVYAATRRRLSVHSRGMNALVEKEFSIRLSPTTWLSVAPFSG
ncbi:unnamed protein product [Heligmosomoides polygyrus]|uniref:Ras-associating domain-containing protein n=1 Tax=Heligmosomoides polygyrus TaxID=6339 RepID=A0A183FP51_HELPZ|nr:unnamed protein product [Heligmosomoides polygyrus]